MNLCFPWDIKILILFTERVAADSLLSIWSPKTVQAISHPKRESTQHLGVLGTSMTLRGDEPSEHGSLATEPAKRKA